MDEQKPVFGGQKVEPKEEVFEKKEPYKPKKVEPKPEPPIDKKEMAAKKIYNEGSMNEIYRKACNKANIMRDQIGSKPFAEQREALIRKYIKEQL